MIKRGNKITALLVVATSVMSTMPVMASQKNPTERLDSLDGGITHAIPFSNGKYLYEGSKGEAEYGVYYNDGTKDKLLDGVDDLDEYIKYGDSSVIVTDGNDEQRINLADGTVSKDGDRDDALVDAKTKLKSKLAKTNRYGSDTEIKSFNEVSNDKFGDGVWYEYTATGNKSYYKDINDEVAPTPGEVVSGNTQIKLEITGFYADIVLDGKTFSPPWGSNLPQALATSINKAEFDNYTVKSAVAETVDGDNNKGKVTVVLEAKKELTSVPAGLITLSGEDKTSEWALIVKDADTVPDEEPTDEEKVLYHGYADTKGNYIDCSKIANITVYNGESVVKVDEFNSKKVKDDVKVKAGLPTLTKTIGQDENYIYNIIEVPVTGYQPLNAAKIKSDAVTNLSYVQKISKAQQNKDGGAYLPNKVESYYLCTDSGWDEGDNWAYMAAYNMLLDSNETTKIRIVDGIIYVAKEITNGDNELAVTYGKLKLKKTSKQTPVNMDKLGKRAQIIQPMVFEDKASEAKIGDDSKDTESGDWDIDVKGNVWTIYNGKISRMSQSAEPENIYRCPGMNRLSVYDDNNLVAWEDGGDTYVTVKDGDTATKTVTKTGWQKAEDGKWHLYDLTGKDTKGWINYKSCWYYFNDQGAMQTGWATIDGKDYYFSASGVRATGWIKIDAEWYYLDQSGVKQVNTTIDSYKLNSKGVWIN